MRKVICLAAAAWLACLSVSAWGGEITEAPNYRAYNDTFSSAGQPDAEQLANAAESGVERVIYLSFAGDSTALAGEDGIVIENGMRYVQLPVDWNAPKVEDFRTFAAIMQAEPTAKTLVHCQVNFRASTFSFLYRVAILGESIPDAKPALDSVWNPNETWFRFIRDTLDSYDIPAQCDACDWGENEFVDP